MRKAIIFAITRLVDILRSVFIKLHLGSYIIFAPRTNGLRTLMGKWRAWYCFEKARRQCPAYAEFLQAHPGNVHLHGLTPDFTNIPAMDKANYIKVYPMAARCHGGRLPTRGAVVDTSSGSTGKPTNWVRGNAERDDIARLMQTGIRQILPDQPLLFMNAFALGPWATGMCVSHSVSDECLLVSVGPDVDKIIDVMTDFGSDQFTYIIAGYPPFLKMLADTKALDWSKYKVIAFYGGEGMSEATRSYLLGVFCAVYGDYGASDLEINIGAETDFTIALRRLMTTNICLRNRVNQWITQYAGCERFQDALPYIFQYNQLDYLIDSSDQGELLVTLCRASNIAPKIRYNIHDNGFVVPYKDMLQLLKDEGVDLSNLPAILGMPFLFLYGRSDLAVSYYGCKIPPAAVEKIIFEMPELAAIFNSFRLITREDEQHDKYLTLAIELAQGKALPTDTASITTSLFEALARDSQDYRESSRIAAQRGITPTVIFYRYGEGPFADSTMNVKRRYTEEH